jgi:hypothetical protein
MKFLAPCHFHLFRWEIIKVGIQTGMARIVSLALFIVFILTTCSCSSAAGYPFPTPLDFLPMPSQTRLPSDVSPTDIIGEIFDSPGQYAGKRVEIIGFFHGWDLLNEMQSGPPVTRSDWVIADHGGAIYVTGLTPSNLDPSSHTDMGVILSLDATVQSNPTGLVYLVANHVDILRPWKIELTLLGGLRGNQRVVELANTGEMTVIGQKEKKQVTAQVLNERTPRRARILF